MAGLAIDIAMISGTSQPSVAQAPTLRGPADLGLGDAATPPRIDRHARATALGLAIAAHAVILAVLLREPDDVMAGGGGEQIEAISVTIVSSNVLESVVTERALPTAAAAEASVEATEGAPESAPAAAAKRQKTRTEKEPETATRKPQEAAGVADEALFEMPKESQRRQEEQSVAAPAAGGAAARADAAVPAPVSAPAAASAGAAREYARYVSQALSRSKPRGGGRHGTVWVKFVIAADGSLASAEITRTSGDGRLDASALEALRQARFPVPPSGMSLAQLTYEVPYYFR